MGIAVRIAGEFQDRALLSASGQAGVGVFIAPSVIAAAVMRRYDVRAIGITDSVRERFYAISAEQRLRHSAAVAVSDAARGALFLAAIGAPSRSLRRERAITMAPAAAPRGRHWRMNEY